MKESDETACDNGAESGTDNDNNKKSEDAEENPSGDGDDQGGDDGGKEYEQNTGKGNDDDDKKDEEKPPKENGDKKAETEEEIVKNDENNEENDEEIEEVRQIEDQGSKVEVVTDDINKIDIPLDQIALPPPINVQDIKIPEGKSKLLTFVKVLSQDGMTELEWPAEMIQYTATEPKLTYSCNPLYFDLGALCGRSSRCNRSIEKDSDHVKNQVEKESLMNSGEEVVQDSLSLTIAKSENLSKGDEAGKETAVNVDEPPAIKPKKKTKHRRKHKKKKKLQKDIEKREKKAKRKKKHKNKKAKDNLVDEGKGEVKETQEAVVEEANKEKSKKKSKHKKKKKKHRKTKKRKHEVGDDININIEEKKIKIEQEEKEDECEGTKLKVSPPEMESESQNTDDMKALFKMKFKSTIKSGLIKPEPLEEEEAAVDEQKPVSKMTSLAARIEENEKIKEKENSSQRSAGSRKRTISDIAQNTHKHVKKAKKTGKKKKVKAVEENSEKADLVPPVDRDFNGDDGTNVPKWDTSDSELEGGTTSGFGKITQLDLQQASNLGNKGAVTKTAGDSGNNLVQKQANSDRHQSRSSRRSRSYSRSRYGRSHSSDSDYSHRSSYSSYSRSRSRSYSRSYTRSRSYSSYSDYSSRSRSYSSYSSRSRSHSYRSRSYSRSRRRHRSYSRDSYSSSDYSRSRSRSFLRSRSRSRSHSSLRDLLKESPDKEYSSLLPKRDPKPAKKMEKDREQRKFDPNDLMVAVPINSEEISCTAQDLLKKVKEKEADLDGKSPSLTTKVQSSNGKAVVPLIDKMPSARKKDEGAELIPLPSGKQPGKGPQFIGPTLPPDHPLAHLQDIPVPPSKEKTKKTDLSKVPLPPPITMANAKNMKFLSRVPPPPPPPIALDKDGLDQKVSPGNGSEEGKEGDKKGEGLLAEVVIPPEQAQMYIALQKQARKHARKQKREDGEDVESSSESEPEPDSEPDPSVQDENDTLIHGEPVPVATPVTPLPQVMLTPTPMIPGATLQSLPVHSAQPQLVPVAISGGGVVMMAQSPIQTFPQAAPTIVQMPGGGTAMVAVPHPATSAAYAQAVQVQQAQAIQASQIAAHNQLIQQQLALGGQAPLIAAGQALPGAVLAASPHPLQLAAPAGAHVLAGHQPGTVMLGPAVLMPRVRHHPALQ